jgi:hypothetical protein
MRKSDHKGEFVYYHIYSFLAPWMQPSIRSCALQKLYKYIPAIATKMLRKIVQQRLFDWRHLGEKLYDRRFHLMRREFGVY